MPRSDKPTREVPAAPSDDKAARAAGKKVARDRKAALHAEKTRLRQARPALTQMRAARRRLDDADRQWRDEFFAVAERATPYVAVETDVGLFFVSTGDKIIGRKLFANRSRKEDKTLERALLVLEAAGRPAARTTFVDLGANIGTATIAAVRRHGYVSAIAFEPAPENVTLLRLNALVNGLEQTIRVMPLAVSDRTADVDLQLVDINPGGHFVALDGADHDPAPSQALRVRATSLDALVDERVIDPSAVGLLWMDIQGHEVHALAGARRLLERSVPIVIELAPHDLRRAGRLEELPAILGRCYTHVVDLHRAPGSDAEPRLLPLAELPQIIAAYEADQGFTDLLVCRI